MRFLMPSSLVKCVPAVLAAFWILGCSLPDAKTGVDVEPGVSGASGVYFPHEKSDLAPDPAVRFGKLDNGLRYVLLENREPRDRVSMHLNVQAGSLHETEQQRGLAHFLEHMLFNGSENFPPGELVKYFQRIGMKFGPDANAHTGLEETGYDILLPDGGNESIAEGLLVLRDYAAGALLLEEEVERERGVILAEMQARDSAAYRTFVSTFRFEMDGTRAAKRLPIGTEDAIRAATRQRLKAYYDAWYRPDKMVLVLVGDFDAAAAEQMIRDRFSPLVPRAGTPEDPPLGKLAHQAVKPFYHFEAETGETTVSIEVLTSVPPRDDSLALQIEELLSRAAHRIVQHRLDRMLQEPDAPFTSAYISAGRYLGEIAYAEISAKGPPENWRQRLSALEQVLRQAERFGFTEAELDRVRKEMLAEMDTAVRKASTRSSQQLARKMIRHMNSNRVFSSPQQTRERLAPVLSGLTPGQVHEAFQDAWRHDHRLVLVTGNARIQDRPEAAEGAIRAAYAESAGQPVAAYAARKTAAFPFFPVPQDKADVFRRKTVDDLGIVQVDFANGVRLNFKQTDFKADEVSIRMAFGHGRSDEPAAMPGLSEATAGIVEESGLGPLTDDDLKRALAGTSTRISFRVMEDHFRFEGSSVPDELELAFQLLYGHLTAPAFRQEALDLTVRRLAQEYESLSRSIDGRMKIEGRRFLAGGDSRFGPAEPESLSRITLADVEGWLGPALTGAKLEVSVVGDADEASVVALASRYLGTLPPRAGIERTRSRGPAFPAGASKTVSVPTDIVKSLVLVSWPTEDFWDIGRTRRLSVLSSVFSEKLRERIREALGVAYSPYAYHDPSRAYEGYGRLDAVVPTDPQAAMTVVAEIRKIAQDLADTTLTGDEMQRVMEPILTGIKDLRRTNGYWIDSVLSGSVRHPRQIDWARSIAPDYASIGAADVREMARRYLDNRRAATVVVRPVE